jgi:hypothetical protein
MKTSVKGDLTLQDLFSKETVASDYIDFSLVGEAFVEHIGDPFRWKLRHIGLPNFGDVDVITTPDGVGIPQVFLRPKCRDTSKQDRPWTVSTTVVTEAFTRITEGYDPKVHVHPEDLYTGRIMGLCIGCGSEVRYWDSSELCRECVSDVTSGSKEHKKHILGIL